MTMVGPAWKHQFGPAALAAPAYAFHRVPVKTPEDAATSNLRLARAALARNDLAAALEAIDRALAEQADLGVAHAMRAVVLTNLGRDAEAHTALERANDMPDAREARLFLARLHAQSGQLDPALAIIAPDAVLDHEFAARVAEDRAFRSFHDHPAFLQSLGRI